MNHKMFCYQCQESCHNTGCTLAGMCGKNAVTAHIMDELICQLKILSLARPADKELGRLTVQTLFMTVTNTNFDQKTLTERLEHLKTLNHDAILHVPAGVLSCTDENLRSLRELILYGLKGIAAYTEHAAILGFEDMSIYSFIFRALAATVNDDSLPMLIDLIDETGSYAVKAMALLDQANTNRFGTPRISKVRTGVNNRPGILVSGHDLLDLKELLEQTVDSGIDIYTHGEMLAAHYYPELQKFPHLYGNYGNAWYHQTNEFASFKGPILMTSNCITPVSSKYSSRIFTTGMAGFPGIPHIADRINGKPKDFSAVIALAKTSLPPEELENSYITGGFAHGQLELFFEKIVDAVKAGCIKRFIVMAGCDGRHDSREYYTKIAEQLPPDTIILTAGCAKYRYNKLDLGNICGIPRVLDAGQCNDSYSLVVIALKLKEYFKLDDVNKLPLSFDIAWYEQKAVAVLLALLALGFKNIRLGPTLPAFLTPATAKLLTEKFNLQGINDPADDIAAMLAGA